MARKKNTLDLTQLINHQTTKVSFNDIEFNVKNIIGLKEMAELVNYVVEGCFADDSNRFMPEYKNYLTSHYILLYYTDLNLGYKSEKVYELIYSTNIMDVVIENINESQLLDIKSSIDIKIKHESLINERTVMTKIDKFNTELEEMMQSYQDAINALSSSDNISTVLNALTNLASDDA